MKAYLSGPMTGYPDLNFAAFERAEARLRRLGIDVVNPFHIGEEDTTLEIVTPKMRAQYLRLDIAALVHCDALVAIDGWRRSTGANIEMHVAQLCGLEIFEFFEGHRMPALFSSRPNHQLINRHLNDLEGATHAISH